ncbi:MAG: endonuclease/exonuclease/phosphatase family protein [Bacteroidota bacterium]
MFIVHRIIFVLNALFIVLLLASYLAPYVSPQIFWPIAFLGLAYPVLLITNLLFIIYWIIFFKLKFLFSLAAIICGFHFIPYFVQLNAKKTNDYTNSIRLMSFNIKYFGAYDGKKIDDADKFFEILQKVDPDVLCFQEFKNEGTNVESPVFKKLFKTLKNYYHYNTCFDKRGFNSGNSVVTFSRFPIIDSGEVEHEKGINNFTVYTDIIAHDDTVRIINAHLKSIHFEIPDYNAIQKLDIDNDSSVVKYSNITRKLKTAFIDRAKQASLIRDFIDASPYKIILCGDFNDSPTSYAFRTIKGNMKDAFSEAGSGLGRTYVGPMPSFRIDQVMLDPSFTVFNYYAKSFDFSDHKMVTSTVKIK